jgi:adenosylhomocysteine nucleosidase
MTSEIVIITALDSELDKNSLPSGINIIYSGIGKINAAIATLNAIHKFNPKYIVNFGTVGTVKASIRGLIQIKTVLQRDMCAEPLAPRGKTPFCTRPAEYHSIEGKYICGTGDSFVTIRDPWLEEQKVDVVDMELFAIAAIAHESKVPWYSFKYITDDANESSGATWSEAVNHGEQLFLDVLKTKFL